MIRLLADENLDGRLIRGLQRHYPEIDLLRIQATEAFRQSDEVVLAVAASAGRVLVTHDAATMPAHAMARVSRGEPMAGVVIIPPDGRLTVMIAEIALVATCSEPEELRDRVLYLQSY